MNERRHATTVATGQPNTIAEKTLTAGSDLDQLWDSTINSEPILASIKATSVQTKLLPVTCWRMRWTPTQMFISLWKDCFTHYWESSAKSWSCSMWRFANGIAYYSLHDVVCTYTGKTTQKTKSPCVRYLARSLSEVWKLICWQLSNICLVRSDLDGAKNA
jgi:hypothetical protein